MTRDLAHNVWIEPLSQNSHPTLIVIRQRIHIEETFVLMIIMTPMNIELTNIGKRSEFNQVGIFHYYRDKQDLMILRHGKRILLGMSYVKSWGYIIYIISKQIREFYCIKYFLTRKILWWIHCGTVYRWLVVVRFVLILFDFLAGNKNITNQTATSHLYIQNNCSRIFN